MKKIAADRNYRMLKNARNLAPWRADVHKLQKEVKELKGLKREVEILKARIISLERTRGFGPTTGGVPLPDTD